MVKPVNTDAIEKNTGKAWGKWVKELDKRGARDMTHKEIASWLQDEGVSGWWSQSITVAYEQHIGRRQPGQDYSGTYVVSASRTLDGTMDEVMARWQSLVGARKNFDDVPITRSSVTKSPKYRNWRCTLADGTRVVVGVSQKSPDKALLALAHEKLPSPSAINHWRPYWQDLLAEV